MIRAFRKFQGWTNTFLDFVNLHGRNAEWATVIAKLGMAYSLALPGETLNLKTYENVKALGMTDSKMVFILTVVAVIHAAALMYNGAVKRTPTWRGACCFAGMLIFAAMGYMTWTSNMVTTGMLPMLFFSLTFLELTGCRRAGDDRRCLMQQ